MSSKPRDWEEAFDQIVEEKREMLVALETIVTLWTMEAPLNEFENAISRAVFLLDKERTRLMRD